MTLVLCCWALVLAFAFWRFGATRTEDLYLLFAALGLVSLASAWALPHREQIVPRLAGLLPLGGYLAFQVWRQPTLESAGYLHLMIGWLALVWALLFVSSHSRAASSLATVLTVLGVMEALAGAVQALGGVDYIGGYFRDVGAIATGTLINRNHFAGLLNMIWPLALASVAIVTTARRPSRVRSWGVLAGCAIMGTAVLLSQSRGGTLVMLATAVFMTSVLFVGRRVQSGGVGILVPIVLILAVGMFGLMVGLEPLAERFGGLEKEVSRLDVYEDTLSLIGEQPLTGVGPGMYRWHFRPHQSVWAGVWYQHAHNDYLESAAEWGVPVALLIWSGMGWRCFKAARTYLESSDPRVRALSLGASAAMFSMGLHSLVDLNLQVPGNLMVFTSVIGLGWALDLQRPTLEQVQ